MRKLTVFLLLVLLLPATFSCREPVPLAPLEPVVTLLTPNDGAFVTGGDIGVRIFLENFTMLSQSGMPNKANEGHVVYYLDAGPLVVNGAVAESPGGMSETSYETSYTWTNVAPGPHTFSVQLVNNDGSPFLPPIAVRANVTVR